MDDPAHFPDIDAILKVDLTFYQLLGDKQVFSRLNSFSNIARKEEIKA